MKKQKQKNKFFKKGFTLLELLIVVAIIGIMTSALFIAMARGGVSNALKVASRQLAGAIRETQTYALTGKQRESDLYPCAFRFSIEPETDGVYYKIDYIPRSINEQCGEVSPVFEIFAEPVKFASVENVTGGDIIFTVPHAHYTSPDPAMEEQTEFIIEKRGQEYKVIVYSSGRIEEVGSGEAEE
ncbi:MAG: type II secretion system protein [Candidatus Moranbacteria bacterium]|nr:type II secretion system protein [Candidatus Moranbacteria bacterium]